MRHRASGRLRNLEQTPRSSVAVSEGEHDVRCAVVADGHVTAARLPSGGFLDRWEGRFGSRAPWAVASLELRPDRLSPDDALR